MAVNYDLIAFIVSTVLILAYYLYLKGLVRTIIFLWLFAFLIMWVI